MHHLSELYVSTNKNNDHWLLLCIHPLNTVIKNWESLSSWASNQHCTNSMRQYLYDDQFQNATKIALGSMTGPRTGDASIDRRTPYNQPMGMTMECLH